MKMIQGRDPEWVNRVFFARFDAWATWFDQLEPAFGSWDPFVDPPLSMKREDAGGEIEVQPEVLNRVAGGVIPEAH